MVIDRSTWTQNIHSWINALPSGTFDLNELLAPVLKGMRPQAHTGRFLFEDVRAGLLPNVTWRGKGVNGQNVYLKT